MKQVELRGEVCMRASSIFWISLQPPAEISISSSDDYPNIANFQANWEAGVQVYFNKYERKEREKDACKGKDFPLPDLH